MQQAQTMSNVLSETTGGVTDVPPAPPPATNSEAAALLRQLLDHTYRGGDAEPGAIPLNGVAARAVLLDLDVNGSRYTLIRESRPSLPPAAGPQPAALSPREQEIVRLIARGLPNKAIASTLDISLWTVATYVRRIYGKMAVNSRAEMVARVLASGTLHDLT
jgi:two-component system, NarL family, nitrate/nitrite response regulator NarL